MTAFAGPQRGVPGESNFSAFIASAFESCSANSGYARQPRVSLRGTAGMCESAPYLNTPRARSFLTAQLSRDLKGHLGPRAGRLSVMFARHLLMSASIWRLNDTLAGCVIQ